MPKVKKTRPHRRADTPATGAIASAPRVDTPTTEESLNLNLEHLQNVTAAAGDTLDLGFTGHQTIPYDPEETLDLRLEIPKKTPSKDDDKAQRRHQAAAVRWVDKLQRPYPTKSEIKQAYNLKLLRHYTDPEKQKEPNFHKPQIQRSARVDKLRKQFPLHLATMEPEIPETGEEMCEVLHADAAAEFDLKRNMQITKSEQVQRLAWKNFATTEVRDCDEFTDDRQAVVLSGLDDRELGLEFQNSTNFLPEWAKWQTGKFAREQRAEQRRLKEEERRLKEQERLSKLWPPTRLGFSRPSF